MSTNFIPPDIGPQIAAEQAENDKRRIQILELKIEMLKLQAEWDKLNNLQQRMNDIVDRARINARWPF